MGASAPERGEEYILLTVDGKAGAMEAALPTAAVALFGGLDVRLGSMASAYGVGDTLGGTEYPIDAEGVLEPDGDLVLARAEDAPDGDFVLARDEVAECTRGTNCEDCGCPSSRFVEAPVGAQAIGQQCDRGVRS